MIPTLKIQNGELVPVGGKALWEDFLSKNDGEIVEIKLKDKTRTGRQNSALHVYFKLLADALNDAGYSVQKTVRFDIPWTLESVKTYLWKPVQEMMIQESSTTKMKTKNVEEIYRVVDSEISRRTGVTVAWPSNQPDTWEI
jgi:hypothetical protein